MPSTAEAAESEPAMVERPFHGPFTWDDLADVPDDGLKREIIEGTLIVSPAPVPRHQLAVVNLAVAMKTAPAHELVVLPSPIDWRYDDDNHVEPDIVVCRRDDLDLDVALRTPATPVLLVEVLSPSNRRYDLLFKRDLYESLGVPHHWLVDPGAPDREPSIEALALDDDGRYRTAARASGEERVVVDEPFPLELRPIDLITR